MGVAADETMETEKKRERTKRNCPRVKGDRWRKRCKSWERQRVIKAVKAAEQRKERLQSLWERIATL